MGLLIIDTHRLEFEFMTRCCEDVRERTYEVCKLSRDFFFFFSFKKYKFNFVFFKVTVLGSHTALETIFPLIIAVLELGYWGSFQVVGYSLLDVF